MLLDVHSLNYFDQKEESAIYELNQLYGFWSAQDYYGFVNTFKYDKEKVLLDKYTIIEEARTRVVYNWLQCFEVEGFSAELEAAGFRVREVHGDLSGAPLDASAHGFAVVAAPIAR